MNRIKRIPRKWVVVAAVLVVLIGGGAVGYTVWQRVTYNRVTAYFSSATGLYEGDDVRVLGVKMGKIDKIEPQPDSTKVTMSVKSKADIPADARAVIIAQSLVSGRFVQLAPVYAGGPTLGDGAVIPVERTAVPVEWDEIKTELNKLATALGPQATDDQGSFGRFVDTAEANLAGNGESLKATLHELSKTVTTFSDGRDDLFGTIRNLQAFVSALSNSNEQIVQFGGRLASVSQVLASSSDELGRALDDLDVALGDVQRFLSQNHDQLTTGVDRLGQATKVLADKRTDLEQVLHIAPNALANFYNIYKPAQGTLTGVLGVSEFANPTAFACGAIEGTARNDAQHTADLCRQLLEPMFNSLVLHYPPILVNPASGVAAFPDQIQYQPPSVANEEPAQPQSVTPVSGARDLGSLLMPGSGR